MGTIGEGKWGTVGPVIPWRTFHGWFNDSLQPFPCYSMKKLGWELRGLFGYGILSQMVQNSELKPSNVALDSCWELPLEFCFKWKVLPRS